jgi:hypothetical protein
VSRSVEDKLIEAERVAQSLNGTARAATRGTLFHGTRNGALIERSGFRSSSGGEFGPGIYLTDFAPTAEFYALRVAHGPEAPSVIKCSVSMSRPFVIAKTDWIALTRNMTPGTVQRRIIDMGYDGIVGLGLTGQPQVVAFSPQQVKYHSTRQL